MTLSTKIIPKHQSSENAVMVVKYYRIGKKKWQEKSAAGSKQLQVEIRIPTVLFSIKKITQLKMQ